MITDMIALHHVQNALANYPEFTTLLLLRHPRLDLVCEKILKSIGQVELKRANPLYVWE